MNRYLVNKEDTKHLRRILVLKKVQWNEKSIEESVKDCNRDKMCNIYYS